MMVPQVVREVLHAITSVHPEATLVHDPFVGSGTILTEAMLSGLSFRGQDINPLAVLVCKTKAGPFLRVARRRAIADLRERLRGDKSRAIAVRFAGRDKWFTPQVQVGLSRIVRAIRAERSLTHRRFFWLALAETVRLTSNSRTSTFKLHTRPTVEIEERNPDPLVIFNSTLSKNAAAFSRLGRRLRESSLLRGGRYARRVSTSIADARDAAAVGLGKADILITSPPYGDNVTTVPYGQFSFLPLQWIDFADIAPEADRTALTSTHEIDFRSLGGTRRIGQDDVDKLKTELPPLRAYLRSVEGQPKDRATRVTAFMRDLRLSIKPILASLNPNAVMVWVLGNRRVGGVQVPLHSILRAALEAEGARWITTLTRRIPSKRMAVKNSVADTMSEERILIMRAAS